MPRIQTILGKVKGPGAVAIALVGGAAATLYNKFSKKEEEAPQPQTKEEPPVKQTKSLFPEKPVSVDRLSTDTVPENFDGAVNLLLDKEGGYVNNPSDPGGETKFGISKRAYPNLDIKNLTREQAVEIYKKDYWDAFGLDKFPPGSRALVLDGAVSHGKAGMQDILTKALFPEWHSGMARPSVEQLANKVQEETTKGNDVKSSILEARKKRYEDIVAKDPSQKQFLSGWTSRLDALSGKGAAKIYAASGEAEPSFLTDETRPVWRDLEAKSRSVAELMSGKKIDPTTGKVVFDLAEHRKILEGAILAEKNAVARAVEAYKAERDDIRKSRLFEGLARSVANLASGLIGLKYADKGISPGPLKFDPSDWAAEYMNAKANLDGILQTASAERKASQRIYALREDELNDYLKNAQGLLSLAKTKWEETEKSSDRKERAADKLSLKKKAEQEEEADKNNKYLSSQETWLEKQQDGLEKGLGLFLAEARQKGLDRATQNPEVVRALSPYVRVDSLVKTVKENTGWLTFDEEDAATITTKLREELSPQLTLPDNVLAEISRMPKGTVFPLRVRQAILEAKRRREEARGKSN